MHLDAAPSLPADAVVHLSFDGNSVDVAIASAPDFEVDLRLPNVNGPRSLEISAQVELADGRRGLAASTTITLNDDLDPPVLALALDPGGSVVAAGSPLHANRHGNRFDPSTR